MPTQPKDLRKRAESFPWDEWDEKLRDMYEPLYREAAQLGAEVSLSGLEAELDESDPFVSKFMTSYIGERITQLQGTTKDRVIDLIRDALDDGDETETPQKLGKAILDTVSETFSGYERWRADRIGRTETGFGFNQGTVLAADQEGFEQVDVTDGDSDPECEEANGAVWSIDDALANPLEHPNCVRAFAPHVD